MPQPATISIPIQTLTPIWTGDHDRKTSYLRATSFLGGIRFWGEALLRSFGEPVCKISSKNASEKCLHNEENHPCAACQVFGCTGLARSFVLKVLEEKDKVQEEVHRIVYRLNKQIKTLESKGRTGQFTLKLSPLRPSGGFQFVGLTTLLMLRYGFLGARDQYGHGWVKTELPRDLIDRALTFVHETQPHKAPLHASDFELPVFKDFFFFDGKVKNLKAPAATFQFDLRASVRERLRSDRSLTPLRHYFCGALRPDKWATSYNFSIRQGGELTGWGWYPRGGRFGSQRDRCLDILNEQLKEHCEVLKWKEFGSSRDNSRSSQDWKVFLEEMIKNPWR